VPAASGIRRGTDSGYRFKNSNSSEGGAGEDKGVQPLMLGLKAKERAKPK